MTAGALIVSFGAGPAGSIGACSDIEASSSVISIRDDAYRVNLIHRFIAAARPSQPPQGLIPIA
jgi:hypothetical protein